MASKTSCKICYKRISDNPKTGVKHYQDKHPLTPEACYEHFERTWDPVYDRLIREHKSTGEALRLTVEKSKKFEQAYQQEAATRNTLATKLNGIIMILEHKA
jgi:hypothetical protein